MADFRGVGKDAVIDSFVRAGLFLRSQNLGDATREALDTWDKNGVTTKIGVTRNDKQLADVMRETGALSNLSYYQDLFVYHAATEQAEGKDRQIQDLYRDLMAWSAFFDGSATPNAAIDKEVRMHIVVDLLNRMAAAGIDVNACQEKVDAAVGEVEKKDKKLAEWLDSAVPVTQLLYSGAEPPVLNQWLSGSSAAQDGCLQRTLYGISNLPPEDKIKAVPKAIELYKVTMSNEAGSPRVMPENQWNGHVQNVKRRFQLAMAPFVSTAQAAKIDVRPVTREMDKWTISFYGTLSAAQTAAFSLKAYNLSVVDPQGRIIEPPPQKLLGGTVGSVSAGLTRISGFTGCPPALDRMEIVG